MAKKFKLLRRPIILGVIMLLAACGRSNQTNVADPGSVEMNEAPPQLPILETLDVPDEARIATRFGDPRPPTYWALWNTCALDNRADVAEANGGRAAGWVLMDDLLADPGIQIGDLAVITCEQGLVLLAGGGEIDNQADAAVYELAAQMLAAEINLNLGAESCPVAEETVVAGHIYLADLGFDGQGAYAALISAETNESISQLVELLQLYNSGALCVE